MRPETITIWQPELPALIHSKRTGAVQTVTSAARHDNPEPPVPRHVATAEKGSPFYGNRQPVPRRKKWPDTKCSGIRNSYLV